MIQNSKFNNDDVEMRRFILAVSCKKAFEFLRGPEEDYSILYPPTFFSGGLSKEQMILDNVILSKYKQYCSYIPGYFEYKTNKECIKTLEELLDYQALSGGLYSLWVNLLQNVKMYTVFAYFNEYLGIPLSHNTVEDFEDSVVFVYNYYNIPYSLSYLNIRLYDKIYNAYFQSSREDVSDEIKIRFLCDKDIEEYFRIYAPDTHQYLINILLS